MGCKGAEFTGEHGAIIARQFKNLSIRADNPQPYRSIHTHTLTDESLRGWDYGSLASGRKRMQNEERREWLKMVGRIP